MIPIFYGEVMQGRLRLTKKGQKEFEKYLRTLEGKEFQLTIERRQRSIPQNAYLWGVVYKIIANDTGMSAEDVHQWCKRKFLGVKVVEVRGEKQEVVRSTTGLKKHDFFEQYIEPIRAWYAGFGGYIPDPGEVSVEDFAPDEPKEQPEAPVIELPKEQEAMPDDFLR